LPDRKDGKMATTTATVDDEVPESEDEKTYSTAGGLLGNAAGVGVYVLVGFAALLMIVLVLIVAFMLVAAVAPAALN
jgi:hypothetical protein